MRQREPVDEARDRVYGPLIKASVQSFTSAVRQIFAPINHIDTGIPVLVADQLPVWGALSWYVPASQLADCEHDGAVFVITSGTFLDRGHDLLRPVAGRQYAPVDLVTLEAKHVVVSLTDLYAAMCEAKTDIEADLRQEFGERPTCPSDAFLRADIDL